MARERRSAGSSSGSRPGKRLQRTDTVVVLAGRDKGKTGVIERILSNGRAIVSGINMVKKHRRPNPQLNEQGGIVEQEAPIHLSNLSLQHPQSGRGSRIGIGKDDSGKRVRVFKSDGAAVPASGRRGK